jgi:NADPH:quinone reductase-like Zn-dependent oxidoreductase
LARRIDTGRRRSCVGHYSTKDAAAGRLDVKPTRIFGFEEIREAHRVMEANEARGKMVVVHA